MRLKNKTAIVTGGGSGFGAGIATSFSKEGAKVFIADIDLEKAKAVAKETGGIPIKVDVSNTRSVETLISQ